MRNRIASVLRSTGWMVCALLLACVNARAQQTTSSPRVGYLSFGTPAESANRVNALRLGLREQGYTEGRNIVLEFRWADTAERLPELAAELVSSKVDLIFAPTSTEVEAARRATRSIPFVFGGHADPVGVGHVASLARPGEIGRASCRERVYSSV